MHHPPGTATRIAWVTPDTDTAGLVAAGFTHVLSAEPVRAPGLRTLIDIDLTHAPAGTGGPFTTLPAPLLDPREPPRPAERAVALVASADDIAALATWWAARIAASKADGVRLLGLADLPLPYLQDFLTALRGGCPGKTLFAWTPGLPWGALDGLPPGTLDLVAASLPWWDGHAPWLWDEIAALRRVAPVVLPATTAPDAAPAHAGLAAFAADGVLIPPAGAPMGGFGAPPPPGPVIVISAPDQPVLALVRADTPDVRAARQASLALFNTGAEASLGLAPLLARLPQPMHFPSLDMTTPVTLPPGGSAVWQGTAIQPATPTSLDPARAATAAGAPRLALEAPTPCVDAGRFPARRIVGSLVEVEVDVIADGHDKLAAALRWQAPGDPAWHEVRMRPLGNDRWAAAFPLRMLGVHRYEIHAWRDHFATYADELGKKHRAGVPVALELREGRALVEATATKAHASAFASLLDRLRGTPDQQIAILLSPETAALMASADPRPFPVSLGPIPIQAERAGAAYASWYEIFPRSMSGDPARHGTFRDVIGHLPRIAAMGFDVLYFPPIHPIGRRNRKGRNNTLTPAADDPGSPYAIGSAEGGHDALHPELGTLEDFQALRTAAAEHGLELAIDFAIQCSPDHPWLTQHPGWFQWRPDGSIRYAENPPKKYEDIVNVDFYAKGAVPSLWVELCRAVLHWAGQGVRLFRVDNPHTKPLPFWEWMIAEVQSRYPDSVFLAEAFTKPKVMYRLGKVGFSQSYTYFTWREKKWEFEQYLTELTQGPPRDFFRPHFFVNTPDINPVYLQGASRGAYLARAALAATLSGLWGVYNGFELCEGTPVPGKEEYLDSEKYQIRVWDWDRPGNIVPEITQLNALRRANPALQSHLGVTFLESSSEQVLFFEKATPERDNVVLVAISMDVRYAQSTRLDLPHWRFSPEAAALDTTDLLTGRAWQWRDRAVDITLTPDRPYAIWRVKAA